MSRFTAKGPKGDQGPAGNGSSTDTYTKIYTTDNGAGTNVKIGDDAWIGDVNQSNNIGIKGVQNAALGGIILGNELTEKVQTNGHDIVITANNDVIFNTGSGYAYMGAPNAKADNRLAQWSQTLIKVDSVPAHNYGVSGDRAGMFAYDSTHLYVCTADYVNNSTVIWQRINWASGNW